MPSTTYTADFETWWAAFPRGRRTKKRKAADDYRKALQRTDAETLLRRATEYAASPTGQGPYVVMPSTWLNGDCWLDADEAWNRGDDREETGRIRVDGSTAAIAAKTIKVDIAEGATDRVPHHGSEDDGPGAHDSQIPF